MHPRFTTADADLLFTTITRGSQHFCGILYRSHTGVACRARGPRRLSSGQFEAALRRAGTAGRGSSPRTGDRSLPPLTRGTQRNFCSERLLADRKRLSLDSVFSKARQVLQPQSKILRSLETCRSRRWLHRLRLKTRCDSSYLTS